LLRGRRGLQVDRHENKKESWEEGGGRTGSVKMNEDARGEGAGDRTSARKKELKKKKGRGASEGSKEKKGDKSSFVLR